VNTVNNKIRVEARIRRERETVAAMVGMYCRAHHGVVPGGCERCAELMAYVDKKLDRCPVRKDKPTCLDCTIHCYSGERREEIRAVMRYAGPRMLFRHPIMALRHLWDSRSSSRRRA